MTSAVEFLRTLGVFDESVTKTGQARLNMDPKAIPNSYLSGVALEWDGIGPSSPVDFIDALHFECVGTTQRDVVVETLASLGLESLEEERINAAA